MIKDYQGPRKICRLVFWKEHDSGVSFPCDEDGNIDLNTLKEADIQAYKNAMSHPENYPYAWNEVETVDREPASGICRCGKHILLIDQYLGACSCPDCGQWYNIFGLELKPVERWNDCGEMDYEY